MKIKKIEECRTSTHLKSFVIEYETEKGDIKKWELISRGEEERLRSEIFEGKVHTDGATIFAVSEDGEKVCMIKEYRVGAGKYIYSLPAGLIDEDEDIEASAVREFKEETGMNLRVEKISKPRYTSIGLTNERTNMVYGVYSGEPSSRYLEASEDITVEIADKNRAKEILEKEDVCLRTALALENYFGI